MNKWIKKTKTQEYAIKNIVKLDVLGNTQIIEALIKSS